MGCVLEVKCSGKESKKFLKALSVLKFVLMILLSGVAINKNTTKAKLSLRQNVFRKH